MQECPTVNYNNGMADIKCGHVSAGDHTMDIIALPGQQVLHLCHDCRAAIKLHIIEGIMRSMATSVAQEMKREPLHAG